MHHSVGATDGSLPQCGTEPSHCGETAVHRAEDALNSIELAWQRAAEAPQRRSVSRRPEDLALRFRQYLQEHPALIGMGIYTSWTQTAYPIFCEAEGIEWPPPYRIFAHALKDVMPRKLSVGHLRNCRWFPMASAGHSSTGPDRRSLLYVSAFRSDP